MRPLGPWPFWNTGGGAHAPIAIAVSGGADSLCLALLTGAWALERNQPLLALVVDHGLRSESATEAAWTITQLDRLAIPARLLTLAGLNPGAGLAERARIARYDALTRACRASGLVDLLLGHHAGDQAETVLMRRRSASGPDGLAGMAPLVESNAIRLLRPLLPMGRDRLRATLRQHGLSWVEDPSNRDRRAERVRVREELTTRPDLARTLLAHARQDAAERERSRSEDAVTLAGSVTLHPEGYAVLPSALVCGSALSGLVRTVGGQPYRPSIEGLARLLKKLEAATLAGTRLVRAGRAGGGWLLIREEAAMQPPVPASLGARWDRRFVLTGSAVLPEGATIGALADGASLLRKTSPLPSSLLRTLPALRDAGGTLLAVPHLRWYGDPTVQDCRFDFQPDSPATEAVPFTLLHRVEG